MRTGWVFAVLLVLGCVESNPQPSPGAPSDAAGAVDVAAGTDAVCGDMSEDAPQEIVADAPDGEDAPPPCAPQCEGAQCGDDSCGKICGTCPDGWECDGGQCVCLPICEGKECGKDGCGGACGTCAAPELCMPSSTCLAKAETTSWSGGVLKINHLEVSDQGLPGYGLDLDDDPGTCAPAGKCQDGIDNALGGILGQVEQYVDLSAELAATLASGEQVLLAEFIGFNDLGTPFQMNMFRGHPVEPVEVCDWQTEPCTYTADPAWYSIDGEPLWSFPNAILHDGKLLAGGPAFQLNLPVTTLFDMFDSEVWIKGYGAQVAADAVVVDGALVGLENAVFGVALLKSDLIQMIKDITKDTDLPVSPGLPDWSMMLPPDLDTDGDGSPDALSFGLRHAAIGGSISGISECTPGCAGKTCGEDGCGWFCGQCPSPYDACLEGACVPCQPDCAGKECGSDGCDGLCGICTSPDGAVCEGGACVDCVPQCTFKECGSDGCLGTCGECPVDQWCAGGTCVGAPCPVPVINCEEGYYALPGAVLHLSAAGSTSPYGGIVGWAWSVDGPPESTNAALPMAATEEVEFLIDAAGTYVFHLDVTDETGDASCATASHQVKAITAQGILVELTWHTPGDPDETDTGEDAGSDLDLHLLHPWAGGPDVDGDGQPDGWYDQPFDCFWFNPNPQWGSFDPLVGDDPELFIDDTDGAGPEGILLEVTEEVTYTVGVHNWNTHGFGASEAVVRVYVNGELAWESPGTWLGEMDMWRVCRIQMPQGSVVPMTDVEGQPDITPAYQHPYFVVPEE